MKQTVKLHLLENRGTPEFVTFGVPFKKGQVKEEDSVILLVMTIKSMRYKSGQRHIGKMAL